MSFSIYKHGIQTSNDTLTGDAGIAINANFITLGNLFDTVLTATNNLSDLASASTARSNLGLGTAATTSSSAYDAAGAAAAVSTALTASIATKASASALSSYLSLAGGTITGTLSAYVFETADGSSIGAGAQANFVYGFTAGGVCSTANNTLDDGAGNIAYANNLYGQYVGGNTYADNNLNLHFATSNAQCFSVFDDTNGQAVIFRVNSQNSLQANPNSVETLNNTLDDGYGNMIVAGDSGVGGTISSAGSALTLSDTGGGITIDIVNGNGITTSGGTMLDDGSGDMSVYGLLTSQSIYANGKAGINQAPSFGSKSLVLK